MLVACRSPIKKFLIKQFLPLGFCVAVILSLSWSAPGDALYQFKVNGWKLVTTINMALIFFIFGITLETSELKAALKGYKVLLLAIVTILFITGLTGFVFINMDFTPMEFGYGLAIFACVPTSLSSGVALVIQGYGNSALALLMTVATNVLGIFISPLIVTMILSSAIKNIKVDALDLVIKLGVSIIIPLIVGKAVRELSAPALRFAVKYKVPLYLINQFQIVMIVWQTLSHSKHELMKQKFYDVLFAIMGAIGQHFFFLLLAIVITLIVPFLGLRMQDAERKAYIIMCSQKSLPTAAVIISYLPSGPSGDHTEEASAAEVATGSQGLGDLGLVAIPCIVFYVMQVFIDAFLANGWASKYEKGQALQDKYADQLAELAKLEPDTPSLIKDANGTEGKTEGIDENATAATASETRVDLDENSDHDRLLGGANAPSASAPFHVSGR
ncbi:putative sodium/metabolite cotransporter BASS4, chloroplastic [Tetrabaena socialis]|uniref:Putative sodium/metabolite cotransporter BASS4, chloroplastic n=1 Tax=Tetrabaena socialis TaxID=47790 RepID=A0A2J7ZWJ5_9CHLO|nr:putative sodium/metabolite cotransporter BASS4, chloroplastic [Tetrabaena socialis]|eukprot:PNH04640.1 putative sodium/metabolite cotransporter BASS4, chloroplastic [Tetrabaena socialis]